MANVAEGMFDEADGILTLISGPDVTKQMLLALGHVIKKGYEEKTPPEELAKRVEKIDPRFTESIRKLAGNSLYRASLLLMVTAIAYTRIQGALANLGHCVGRGTVANVLKRNGLEPAPERGRHTSWSTFLKAHWRVFAASDFLTVEVWTVKGLVTHYNPMCDRLGRPCRPGCRESPRIRLIPG